MRRPQITIFVGQKSHRKKCRMTLVDVKALDIPIAKRAEHIGA